MWGTPPVSWFRRGADMTCRLCHEGWLANGGLHECRAGDRLVLAVLGADATPDSTKQGHGLDLSDHKAAAADAKAREG